MEPDTLKSSCYCFDICSGKKGINFSKLKYNRIHFLSNTQLGHNWGFFIMVTDLPKYMNDVLKFSIKENGFYNALPFLAMWIVAQLTGFVSDFIITKGYMSITNVRKFFTIFGKRFVSFVLEEKLRLSQAEFYHTTTSINLEHFKLIIQLLSVPVASLSVRRMRVVIRP